MMVKAELQHTFKEGDFLTLANGEYSDFTYIGPFRALKEFTTQEAVDDYLSEDPVYEEYPETRYKFEMEPNGLRRYVGEKTGKMLRRQTNIKDESNFHGFLIKEGYIEAMDSIEWHVGTYGRFSP